MSLTVRPCDIAQYHRPAMVLGPRASLLVAALVVLHTLWTSAAPAIAYRLYAQQWHLTHVHTALLFAIYPIIVVAVLTISRPVQDRFGDRRFMMLGLAASLVGSVLFALAHGIEALFIARALMGVGVGLSAGPSTAAVARHTSPHRAALITTIAQAAGLAAGLLLGGALAQYAPWPTRLSFWVLTGFLAPLLIATWFLPQPDRVGPRKDAPRLFAVPKRPSRSIVIATLAAMIAYNHGVMVLSFGGQVAHDLVGSSNALVNGAVLALFPTTLAAFTIPARRLSPRRSISFGAAGSAASMALLSIAATCHDLPLFLLATAAGGAGYSLLFVGALSLINATIPMAHRTGAISTLYLFAYLSMGLFAIALGVLATAQGLGTAIDVGASVIGAASLLALATSLRRS